MLKRAIKVGQALLERERFECEFRCQKDIKDHCEHKMECLGAMAFLARKDVDMGLYDNIEGME